MHIQSNIHSNNKQTANEFICKTLSLFTAQSLEPFHSETLGINVSAKGLINGGLNRETVHSSDA